MLRSEWLPVLMQGSFSEIYVVERASFRILHANPAARKNLQYTAAELAAMTPLDLARNVSREVLENILMPLACGRASRASLDTVHTRKDGSTYPIEFRLLHCASKEAPAYVMIGNDISARHAAVKALRLSETRFRTIVSNTPGLFFQLLRRADGSTVFPYLGEGCHALLGTSAERLRADPDRFADLFVADDRPSFVASLAESAGAMTELNWEGRIHVPRWRDIKWINIRCTPRALPDNAVQWEGIMTNITQSKQEQAEIRRSRAQLAELSAHIQSAKEIERTRIAREIHDDLGGNLTAIKMAMALVKKRLPPEDAALAEKAAYVDTLVDRTIEAIHRITLDLRPGILDFGIAAAIEWQAGEFQKQLGIPCDVASDKDIELPAEQAAAMFRIFQEAVTNIGKHAHAARVAVTLRRSAGSVLLEVVDNGRGIAPTDRFKPKSFGIRGMEERVAAFGGDLAVTAADGGGTKVAIRIPLPLKK